MFQDQFRLLTNRDGYRLKQRRKKYAWRWVREKVYNGRRVGKIVEFKTVEEAHRYLLENFAASVEEDVWTIVEDIDLEVLVNSTNGDHE